MTMPRGACQAHAILTGERISWGNGCKVCDMNRAIDLAQQDKKNKILEMAYVARFRDRPVNETQMQAIAAELGFSVRQLESTLIQMRSVFREQANIRDLRPSPDVPSSFR